MKRSVMSSILFFCLFFAYNVKAAEVSEENYERLRIVFSDRRIAAMSNEDAERFLSYDLESTTKSSASFVAIETNNGYTIRRVDDDYIDVTTTNSTYHETPYKNIEITSTPTGTNEYLICFYVNWLINPRVKSYDVNAFRFEDATVQDGSQFGYQSYYSPSLGDFTWIEYSPNGTNIVKKSNGFGISMNLVDAGSEFETYIDALVNTTSRYAKAYASYQHAIVGVTLAQSQNYNISHNGYGAVVNFATSIKSKYDGMAGVSIDLEYTS